MTLELDKYDLHDLLYSTAHGSHLQQHRWRDAINYWWSHLDVDERNFLYHFSIRDFADCMLNEKYPSCGKEDYLQFLARFKPDNQFALMAKNLGENIIVDNCYMFRGRYYTSYSTFVSPEFIVKVEKEDEQEKIYNEEYFHLAKYDTGKWLRIIQQAITEEKL